MTSKKHILHLAKSPTGGAPARIIDALNNYTDYSATLISEESCAYFEIDTGINGSTLTHNEIAQEIENADIIHLHNRLDKNSTFCGLELKPLLKRKRCLLQYHSHPAIIADDLNMTPQELVKRSDITQLVIAQFQERFYPNALLVPNIPKTRSFQSFPENSNDTLRVLLCPSNILSRWHDRWNSKSIPELMDILIRLQKLNKIKLSAMRNIAEVEFLAQRQQQHMVIDDVCSGSYHITTLDTLGHSRVPVTHIDNRCINTICRISGSKPEDINDILINLHLDQLISNHDILTDRNIDELQERAARGHKWITEHWSPDWCAETFTSIYDKLLKESENYVLQPAAKAITCPSFFSFSSGKKLKGSINSMPPSQLTSATELIMDMPEGSKCLFLTGNPEESLRNLDQFNHIAKHAYLLMDTKAALPFLLAYPNVRISSGAWEHIPFPDNFFDFVILDAPPEVLGEIFLDISREISRVTSNSILIPSSLPQPEGTASSTENKKSAWHIYKQNKKTEPVINNPENQHLRSLAYYRHLLIRFQNNKNAKHPQQPFDQTQHRKAESLFFRETITQLKRSKISSIAICGTKEHTERFLPYFDKSGIQIQSIIAIEHKDNSFNNIKTVTFETFDATNIETIVLSTDPWQEGFLYNLCQMKCPHETLYPLYRNNGWAYCEQYSWHEYITELFNALPNPYILFGAGSHTETVLAVIEKNKLRAPYLILDNRTNRTHLRQIPIKSSYEHQALTKKSIVVLSSDTPDILDKMHESASSDLPDNAFYILNPYEHLPHPGPYMKNSPAKWIPADALHQSLNKLLKFLHKEETEQSIQHNKVTT